MHSSLRINKLFLLNYRNHKKVKIEVNKNIVLLVGKNGSGKTNILESVSLLASSNGMRNSNFKSLISEDSKFDEFGVVINLENSYDSFKVGIGFTKKNGVLKKIIKFNGIEVNKNVIESKFSIFWIIPAMNNIFNSTPVERRNFLDALIFNVETTHKKNLLNYKKLQRDRLKILKKINISILEKKWLDTIESKMGSLAIIISDTRKQLSYKPALEVEENFVKKLSINRKIDSIIGKTQAGVNKTDLKVFNKIKMITAEECSTGEQKVILISIIFLFIQIIKNKGLLNIIFLLDDLFAHLDEFYINLILRELKGLKIQTWISNVSNKLINRESDCFEDIMFLNIKDI
jgi:DNA replication and repair protein RecF